MEIAPETWCCFPRQIVKPQQIGFPRRIEIEITREAIGRDTGHRLLDHPSWIGKTADPRSAKSVKRLPSTKSVMMNCHDTYIKRNMPISVGVDHFLLHRPH